MAAITSAVFSLGARTTCHSAQQKRRHGVGAISHRGGFMKIDIVAKRSKSGGRSTSSLTVRAGGGLNTDKSYNCVVNQDGVIIANDIPSGVYEVSAWWAGATKDGEVPLAPKCDSERQRGCEVRCEMTAEGELVCEGLSSGTYRVINAEEADATCDVDASGDAFECTTSWDESEQAPIVVDTGDLKMQETADDQGFRLGG